MLSHGIGDLGLLNGRNHLPLVDALVAPSRERAQLLELPLQLVARTLQLLVGGVQLVLLSFTERLERVLSVIDAPFGVADVDADLEIFRCRLVRLNFIHNDEEVCQRRYLLICFPNREGPVGEGRRLQTCEAIRRIVGDGAPLVLGFLRRSVFRCLRRPHGFYTLASPTGRGGLHILDATGIDARDTATTL